MAAVSESGIAIAPAPWALTFKSWTFLVSPLSTNNGVNFPSGWAVDWQADTLAGGGKFIGGPGIVMIVSYSDSPVGPYDELVYTPGRWQYPDGTKAYRITRIYVSSKESTENGRRNWNIPKQVASFSYTQDSVTSTWTLKVSSPDSPETPFFSVEVAPIPILSRLRVDLSPSRQAMLGDLMGLVQPPLPKGKGEGEIATDKWFFLKPTMSGSSSVCKLKATLSGGKEVGNGREFPAVSPWTVGLFVEGVFDFDSATQFEL